MRYFQRSVADFTRFLTEDRSQQTLFRCQFCLSFRRYFSDQDISCADFCTDADDSSLIKIFQRIVADSRNISCDLFRSEFCITGFRLIFFNMDRSINVILYETLAQQNGILVVVTLPGHKSDQRVFTKRHLTLGCGRTVCNDLSFFHSLALVNDRSLVVAVALVTSLELGQFVALLGSVVMFDRDLCGSRTLHNTSFFCHDADAGVNCRFYFHTCSDYRSFGCQKRNCLTLHVGSHQRTVRIVIFQERNERCRHGEYHLRRNVHVIELASLIFLCLFTVTTGYILTDKMSLCIQSLIRLCHMIIIFFIRSHIYDFIRNDRILRICLVDLSVRSLDKSVLVDSRIACQRVDQTDVRSLRRLDRTHSSVMGIVNVTDLKSCTVTGKSSRSQCGETSLMCQFSKRVVLIHKLGQLRRSEELFYSCCYRFDVDQ